MTVDIYSKYKWPKVDLDQERVGELLQDHERVMIEAAPGSGKTFTGVYLSLLAVRFGWTSRVRPTLFLTFSRNARTQIEWEVETYRNKGWMTSQEAGAVQVSNYHAFYFEILQRRAGLWGCTGEIRPAVVSEAEARLKRTLERANLPAKQLSVLRNAIRKVGSIFDLTTQHVPQELVNSLREEVTASVTSGRPHYDDFAPLVRQLLRVSPSLLTWLRSTYPLVILDEYQDTDDLQWDILNLWRPCRVAVFYDRFQMIYGWRGASEDRPEQLAAEFGIPGKARTSLGELHRAPDQMEFGKFILSLRRDDLKGNFVEGGNHPWLTLMRVQLLEKEVPSEWRCVNRLRWSKVINPDETTGIITRGNYLARFLHRTLSHSPSNGRGAYFPCSWIGSEDSPEERIRTKIYELRELRTQRQLAKWVGSLVDDLMITPYTVSRKSIMFEKELAKKPDEILARRVDPHLVEVRNSLKGWRSELQVGNYRAISQALRFSLDTALVLTKGRAFIDRDLAWYVRLLHQTAGGLDPSVSWDEFCDRLEAVIASSSHFHSTRRAGVAILTAHQSKGREFDHVIIPWLSGLGEPSGRSQLPYNHGNPEDRRLLYVALTRARKHVTILYPQEDPSPFLSAWKLL